MRRTTLFGLSLTVLLGLTACRPEFGFLSGPGDGAVTCPGGRACPKDVSRPATKYYGIAVPAPDTSTSNGDPVEILCPGNSKCPVPTAPGDVYVGRLTLRSSAKQDIYICQPGQPAPAGLKCEQGAWAVVCKRGDKACPGLPKF